MIVGKTYSVPDERLYPKVVGWVETIYGRFANAEADSIVVAQALGHASVGGAFNAKVAAMSSYALVERRQGKIRVTEVGRMLSAPKDQREKLDGARSAVMAISLWQRLSRDYTSRGRRLPDDFATDLARIAGIPAAQAGSKSGWVARAYADDLGYVESLEAAAKSPAAVAGLAKGSLPKEAASRSPLPGGPEPGPDESAGQIVFVSQRDDMQVSVPRSLRHIPMLRAFIESALAEIEEDLARKSRPEEPGQGK